MLLELKGKKYNEYLYTLRGRESIEKQSKRNKKQHTVLKSLSLPASIAELLEKLQRELGLAQNKVVSVALLELNDMRQDELENVLKKWWVY